MRPLIREELDKLPRHEDWAVNKSLIVEEINEIQKEKKYHCKVLV